MALEDFKLSENGESIIKYTGSDSEVIIPAGILEIGDSAFLDCSGIVSVHIPETVEKIGRSAFEGCRSLVSIRIPASVNEIGFSAFSGCKNLEQIGSPTGLQTLCNSGGFGSCLKLADVYGFIIINGFLAKYIGNATDITVPSNVKTICSGAFSNCLSARSITIPESVKKIECYAFQSCRSLKTLSMNGPVQVEEDGRFSGCNLDIRSFGIFDIFWFYLNFTKGKEVTECEKRITENVDASIRKMLILMDGKAADNNNLRLAKLIVKYRDKISDETLKLIQEYFERNITKQAVKLLAKNNIIKGDEKTEAKKLVKEKEEKAVRAAEQEADAEKLRNHERPDEKEVEKYVSDLMVEKPLRTDLNYSLKKPVFYRNSHIPVQETVLKMILSIYAEEFKRIAIAEYGGFNKHYELYDSCRISVSKEADYIYSYIDPVSFDAFLGQIIYSQQYRDYVLSFARFATESCAEFIIANVKSRKHGTAKERYWANNVEQALIISDTHAAMKYYESVKKLDAYAAMRNMTAQEFRDTFLIPDYGFDENGIKKYQLGNLDLNVTVKPDLTLAVYDCNAGKELRSFPSKADNIDEVELKKLKEDYKTLGKEVKKFGKEKLQNIKQLHITGVCIGKDTWIKTYVEQPVIRNLSECIVWSDGERYFIPTRSGIVDVNGNQYEPAGKITVANVLDMEQAEISEWQKFIIDHNIKQPFEQMWEPAFDLNKYYGTGNFTGLTVTSSERNAMKKGLKEKGIEVYSDEVYSEYDHRAGKYLFNNRNSMHFGPYADADYLINDDKSITFESICFKQGNNKNAINTILFSLHKILVEQTVSNDCDDKLNREELDLFTLAQILSFIALAEKCQSIRCKAVLLDYKNEKYPDYSALDDLILEL